jgi:hypothetical protein
MDISNIYNELINESQQTVIERMVKFLNSSYVPKIGVKRDDTLAEYGTEPSIVNKVDGEVIQKDSLIDYIKSKFKDVSTEFIEQVINDWGTGKYKNGDYQLSKNTPM